MSKLQLKGMAVIDLLSDYKPPKLESTSPSKKQLLQKSLAIATKRPESTKNSGGRSNTVVKEAFAGAVYEQWITYDIDPIQATINERLNAGAHT